MNMNVSITPALIIDLQIRVKPEVCAAGEPFQVSAVEQLISV